MYKKGTHSCLWDHVRINAYDQWISENVKDKTVCDLGAGTGILCWSAYKHGAKKVFGIEYQPDVYNELCFRFRNIPEIQIIKGDIFKMDFPEADIYLQEMYGSAFFCEGILSLFENAKRQNLENNIWPNKVTLYGGISYLEDSIDIGVNYSNFSETCQGFFDIYAEKINRPMNLSYYSSQINRTVFDGYIKDIDIDKFEYVDEEDILWDSNGIGNFNRYTHWIADLKWGNKERWYNLKTKVI